VCGGQGVDMGLYLYIYMLFECYAYILLFSCSGVVLH
jgi:hypothetical protein